MRYTYCIMNDNDDILEEYTNKKDAEKAIKVLNGNESRYFICKMEA